MCLCLCIFLFVSLRLCHCHDKLSENIWFVWSRKSYGGDKWRCHHGDGRTFNGNLIFGIYWNEYRATQSVDNVRLSFAILVGNV